MSDCKAATAATSSTSAASTLGSGGGVSVSVSSSESTIALPGVDGIDCFPIPHLSHIVKGGLAFYPRQPFVRTRAKRALSATSTSTSTSATAATAATAPATATPMTTATAPPSGGAEAAPAKSLPEDELAVVMYDVVRNITCPPGCTPSSVAAAVAACSSSSASVAAAAKQPLVATTSSGSGSASGSALFRAADSRGASQRRALAFPRGGPKSTTVWKAGEVVAAIVTAGGLCPGINDVISELVQTLYYAYGVETIWGVRQGFRGFYEHNLKIKAKTKTNAADAKSEPKAEPNWMLLTPANTQDIHLFGGTILGSSRGGFDGDTERVIIDECVARGVNQVYVIGGDGSHRAANKLALEAARRHLKLTVGGIPKTVDNDVAVIDSSFGFQTAVSEAVKAVRSAAVEARSTPNGIGLVTLMGRTAGHIAANATLASREVDLCLIPEVPFSLKDVLEYLKGLIEAQGHAVVVVAEGAGINLLPATGKKDASGNAQLPPIGSWLHAQIDAYFAGEKMAVSTKPHDPAYMIRSVPCNAADAIMCASLAQAAVHAAMHGFTAFSAGTVNNRTALIPLLLIANHSPALLDPKCRTWERVLATTQQPSDLNHAVAAAPATTAPAGASGGDSAGSNVLKSQL